jgi:hypothetical protein
MAWKTMQWSLCFYTYYLGLGNPFNHVHTKAKWRTNAHLVAVVCGWRLGGEDVYSRDVTELTSAADMTTIAAMVTVKTLSPSTPHFS